MGSCSKSFPMLDTPGGLLPRDTAQDTAPQRATTPPRASESSFYHGFQRLPFRPTAPSHTSGMTPHFLHSQESMSPLLDSGPLHMPFLLLKPSFPSLCSSGHFPLRICGFM